MSEKPMSAQWSDSQMDRINLRAENDRLREQIAGLTAALADVGEEAVTAHHFVTGGNLTLAIDSFLRIEDLVLAALTAPAPTGVDDEKVA